MAPRKVDEKGKTLHSELSDMCLEQALRLYPTPMPPLCASFKRDLGRQQISQQIKHCSSIKASRKEAASKCMSLLSLEVNDLVTWLSEEALVHRPKKLIEYFANILEVRVINITIDQILLENIIPLDDDDDEKITCDEETDWHEIASDSEIESRGVSFPSICSDDLEFERESNPDPTCLIVDPVQTTSRMEKLRKLGLSTRLCGNLKLRGLDSKSNNKPFY